MTKPCWVGEILFKNYVLTPLNMFTCESLIARITAKAILIALVCSHWTNLEPKVSERLADTNPGHLNHKKTALTTKAQ